MSISPVVFPEFSLACFFVLVSMNKVFRIRDYLLNIKIKFKRLRIGRVNIAQRSAYVVSQKWLFIFHSRFSIYNKCIMSLTHDIAPFQKTLFSQGCYKPLAPLCVYKCSRHIYAFRCSFRDTIPQMLAFYVHQMRN